MDALVEALQPRQAKRTNHADQPAQHQQHRDRHGRPPRQGFGAAHSITSPRIRNLASAMVETKPSKAMISAASK